MYRKHPCLMAEEMDMALDDVITKNKKKKQQTRRSFQAKEELNDMIVVEGFHPSVSEREIKTLFSIFGIVRNVRLILNRNRMPTGMAEVVFVKPENAKTALKRYNGFVFEGVRLRIEMPPVLRSRAKLRHIVSRDNRVNARNPIRNNKQRKDVLPAETLDANMEEYMKD